MPGYQGYPFEWLVGSVPGEPEGRVPTADELDILARLNLIHNVLLRRLEEREEWYAQMLRSPRRPGGRQLALTELREVDRDRRQVRDESDRLVAVLRRRWRERHERLRPPPPYEHPPPYRP